jgi:hypothetical protein
VPLTTNTTVNIGILALTAGDWDVWGIGTITPSAGMTLAAIGIGTASATLPTANQVAQGQGTLHSLGLTFTNAIAQTLPTAAMRVNVNVATNIYLTARATFSSGTVNATGYAWARRVARA